MTGVAIILAGLGLLIGSFIGVVVERWPRGEGFARGRSRCDGCGRTLNAAEMVPLLSWLWLRGRCRTCGARVSPLLPLLEIGAAAIGGIVGITLEGLPGAAGGAEGWLHPAWLAAVSVHMAWLVPVSLHLAWAPFGWALLCLAALDYRAMWLPDRLTLPLLALGLLIGAAKGQAVLALAGAGIGWALLVLVGGLYERARGRAGLGGGDPKLLAAIGAWLGPGALPLVIVAASVAGLGVAMSMKVAGHEVGGATRMPFGTLLALGAGGYFIALVLGGAPAFSILG
ncbi:prepilin peptidase [Pacificimonas sp. ICDLI1SI03]